MTDYFTEQDDVLENLLGINDPERLKAIESDVVSIKLVDLAKHPIEGNFDFAHLKAIHQYLFGDIYSFAGKTRTISIAKAGSAFCYAENIEAMQLQIFKELKKNNYLKNLDREVFICKLADFAGDLNALHPFREGNGRTARVFLIQLAYYAGYNLAYEESTAEEILTADIASFHGDMKPIQALFQKILHPL